MCTPLTHWRRRGYQFTDANQKRPARKLSTLLSQQHGVNGLYYRLFGNPPNINVHMIGPKTDFWETPQPGSSQILRKPYINSLMDACDNPYIAVAGVSTQVTNDKGRYHSLLQNIKLFSKSTSGDDLQFS